MNYAKAILDLEVIKPKRSWKNAACLYNIKWNNDHIDDDLIKKYLEKELKMTNIKDQKLVRTDNNKGLKTEDEGTIIMPAGEAEFYMDDGKTEPTHLIANIVNEKVMLLNYYYHKLYLDRILRPLKPNDPIVDEGEHEIRHSFDELLGFFETLEYMLKIDLITDEEKDAFRYYISKAAECRPVIVHLKRYQFELNGRLDERLSKYAKVDDG